MTNNFSEASTAIEQAAGKETARGKIREDFMVWVGLGAGKAGLRTFLRLALLAPGFQLALSVRIQEALLSIPLLGKILRRLLWYGTTIFFGSEISLASQIGGGLYLPHPWGIVIGDGVVIGKGVSIFQQVSLGRRNYRKGSYPTVKDHAVLYAGAKVFGRVTVGERAVVGSGAVVLLDVPADCAVMGNPAEIVSSPR